MSTEKQANRHTMEPGETVYDDMAQASTAVSAALLPKDRRPSAISLLKLFRCFLWPSFGVS